MIAQYIRKSMDKAYAKYIAPRLEREISGSELRDEAGMPEAFHDEDYHYLFYREPESRLLLVVFQAANKAGPRYNYLSTLSGFQVNRLYIKDDLLPSGTYYLGRNGDNHVEEDICLLIDRTVQECGAEKILFAGSSKGGYAAVNYGVMYPDAAIIAGAPQYYLGRWMDDASRYHEALSEILGGEVTKKGIRMLDTRLQGKILGSPYAKTQKAYIHCSRNDHTWELHTRDMVRDLEESGMQVFLDQPFYEDHSDVAKYFPAFLSWSLRKETGGKNGKEMLGMDSGRIISA